MHAQLSTPFLNETFSFTFDGCGTRAAHGMAPKSRQAQQQARTERAEAGSPASQAHAASAANAAPQGDLHSTREELDPEVLRRAIERGDEAAVEQVVAACTTCMGCVRRAWRGACRLS